MKGAVVLARASIVFPPLGPVLYVLKMAFDVQTFVIMLGQIVMEYVTIVVAQQD